MPNKISGRVEKERYKRNTLKRNKRSSAIAFPEIEALNQGHFEKEVVEWMTKKDKLQVLVYYRHFNIIIP